MDVRSITLSAGVPTKLVIPGRFFILIETGEALDVDFERRNGRLGQTGRAVEAGFKVFPGDWANPDDFSFDAVVLTSTNAQTVRYGISDHAADYDATLGQVTIQPPNGIDTTGDVTVNTTAGGTVIRAANASRRKIILMNIGAEPVRIGDGDVAATQGIRLAQFQSITLETTAEIRGITAASSTTVAVLEETRV